MTPNEPIVSPDTPMPTGYGFLSKGDPFMTALCRRKTHEAKKPLYVVVNKKKPEGLRAPKWIISEVRAEEQATRLKRRAAVEKRDATTQDTFENSVLKLFPKMPRSDVAMILKRTLKKRSGRVGRTGKLELDEKARLAVQAHVRHCHTNYDKIIRKTSNKGASRRAVNGQISQVLADWGGEARTLSRREEKLKVPKRKLTHLVPSRETKRGGTVKVMGVATKRKIDRPGLNPPRQTLGGTNKPAQQQPAVIDLTLDETEESEMSSGEEDDSDEKSEEEYEESEDDDDESEDDPYEWSDMTDSDWQPQ